MGKDESVTGKNGIGKITLFLGKRYCQTVLQIFFKMMKFSLILTQIFCISILIVAETLNSFINCEEILPSDIHIYTYNIYIYEFWIVTSIAL